MENLGGFRDLASEVELILFKERRTVVHDREFLTEALPLLCKLDLSSDPRARMVLVPRVEAAVRQVWVRWAKSS